MFFQVEREKSILSHSGLVCELACSYSEKGSWGRKEPKGTSSDDELRTIANDDESPRLQGPRAAGPFRPFGSFYSSLNFSSRYQTSLP
jgi:hypothetical protein